MADVFLDFLRRLDKMAMMDDVCHTNDLHDAIKEYKKHAPCSRGLESGKWHIPSELIEPLLGDTMVTAFDHAMQTDHIQEWEEFIEKIDALGYLVVVNNAPHASLAYGSYESCLLSIAEARIKYLRTKGQKGYEEELAEELAKLGLDYNNIKQRYVWQMVRRMHRIPEYGAEEIKRKEDFHAKMEKKHGKAKSEV